MQKVLLILLLPLILFLSACTSSYRTPAAGVNLASITDSAIVETMAAEATANFPARIAIVRVQASGYRSRTNQGFGSGAFSIVTVRDVEKPEDLQRLAQLPQIAALAFLNRLVLPNKLETIKDLRLAAAPLKTDLLFIYSIDTDFNVNNTPLGPLSLVTLGFLPNNEAQVLATVSGALIDVRSGFIYGLAEGSAQERQLANAWTTAEAIDAARIQAESRAFSNFLTEVEKLWWEVIAAYAK